MITTYNNIEEIDDLCEWDPENDEPSKYVRDYYNGTIKHIGCINKATLSVGSKDDWHICESCARLPEFKKYIENLNHQSLKKFAKI